MPTTLTIARTLCCYLTVAIAIFTLVLLPQSAFAKLSTNADSTSSSVSTSAASASGLIIQGAFIGASSDACQIGAWDIQTATPILGNSSDPEDQQVNCPQQYGIADPRRNMYYSLTPETGDWTTGGQILQSSQYHDGAKYIAPQETNTCTITNNYTDPNQPRALQELHLLPGSNLLLATYMYMNNAPEYPVYGENPWPFFLVAVEPISCNVTVIATLLQSEPQHFQFGGGLGASGGFHAASRHYVAFISIIPQDELGDPQYGFDVFLVANDTSASLFYTITITNTTFLNILNTPFMQMQADQQSHTSGVAPNSVQTEGGLFYFSFFSGSDPMTSWVFDSSTGELTCVQGPNGYGLMMDQGFLFVPLPSNAPASLAPLVGNVFIGKRFEVFDYTFVSSLYGNFTQASQDNSFGPLAIAGLSYDARPWAV